MNIRAKDGDLGLRPELAAESHGDVPFLSDQPWWSYPGVVNTVADLACAVADYADRLWAAGLRRGQYLAVFKSNHIDIQAIAAAAARIGAVPVLLSVQMEPAEMIACLGLLDKPTVLLDGQGARQLRGVLDGLALATTRVWSLDDASELGSFLGERNKHVVGGASVDRPMVLTHSSGTTGTPKLAIHSSRSLFGHVAPQIELSLKMGVSEQLTARCLSFVHARNVSGLLTALHTPQPFLAINDPDLAATQAALLTHRPDALETHPNIFMFWEPLARESSRPFSSVRRFTTTFDAVHPRTVRTFLNASSYADAEYLQVYGQTETGPLTYHRTTRADLGGYKARDVGRPFDGHTRVRVVDDEGAPVGEGAVGHVQVQSPGRVVGLLGASAPGGQWWATGDLGAVGRDGHLELLDRAIDQVPGVPSALVAEDGLLEAIEDLTEVVLLSDPNDRACVAVVTTAGDRPLPSEVWRSASEAVGLPADARLVQLPWKELPMTGSWKVRRHRLRELVGQSAQGTGVAAQ